MEPVVRWVATIINQEGEKKERQTWARTLKEAISNFEKFTGFVSFYKSPVKELVN